MPHPFREQGRVLPVGAICMVLVFCSSAIAQSWFPVTPGGWPIPPARRNHAMAYIAQTQSLVGYGGLETSGLADDTPLLRDLQWNQFNSGPQDRQDTAMAYDKKRGVILLYGGRQTGTSFAYASTFSFDGEGWDLENQYSNPGGKYGHALAYDPVSERIIMFGGSSGPTQTWLWDGTEWLASFTPNFPPGRSYHTMALDEGLQRVVLVGGRSGNTFYGDTWIWNGTTWVQLVGANVPPRSNHAMAYDIQRQRMVLSGGVDASGAILASTYEFDGVVWQDVTGPNAQPRRDHAMAYDESLGCVIRWGGFNGQIVSSVEANRPLQGTVAGAFTYGEGCGQPMLELRPDARARPLLGQTAGVFIDSAPTQFGGLMIGFSDQMYLQYPLPVTLGIYGMNGCDLLQSADVVGILATAAGPGTLYAGTSIPASQPLIGLHAYLQAYCFAPGANAFGMIVSDGVEWRLGAL